MTSGKPGRPIPRAGCRPTGLGIADRDFVLLPEGGQPAGSWHRSVRAIPPFRPGTPWCHIYHLRLPLMIWTGPEDAEHCMKCSDFAAAVTSAFVNPSNRPESAAEQLIWRQSGRMARTAPATRHPACRARRQCARASPCLCPRFRSPDPASPRSLATSELRRHPSEL